MRARNLVGQKFGRLTVESKADNSRGGRTQWNCACECGATKVVRTSNLTSGHTKSCGCLRSEEQSARISAKNLRHGHNKVGRQSKTHKSWVAMHHRCRGENYSHYAYYGGRGIKVCSRWESFENFLEDMGERPPGTTLDRIDVNGNYEPENCRWATLSEQQKNKRCHVDD